MACNRLLRMLCRPTQHGLCRSTSFACRYTFTRFLGGIVSYVYFVYINPRKWLDPLDFIVPVPSAIAYNRSAAANIGTQCFCTTLIRLHRSFISLSVYACVPQKLLASFTTVIRLVVIAIVIIAIVIIICHFSLPFLHISQFLLYIDFFTSE